MQREGLLAAEYELAHRAQTEAWREEEASRREVLRVVGADGRLRAD